MDSSEQARFDRLYAQHLRALTRQGKAPKTIDAYARALRRVPTHFDRCPDRLDAEDFKSYFADLARSWRSFRPRFCASSFWGSVSGILSPPTAHFAVPASAVAPA